MKSSKLFHLFPAARWEKRRLCGKAGLVANFCATVSYEASRTLREYL